MKKKSIICQDERKKSVNLSIFFIFSSWQIMLFFFILTNYVIFFGPRKTHNLSRWKNKKCSKLHFFKNRIITDYALFSASWQIMWFFFILTKYDFFLHIDRIWFFEPRFSKKNRQNHRDDLKIICYRHVSKSSILTEDVIFGFTGWLRCYYRCNIMNMMDTPFFPDTMISTIFTYLALRFWF